jgi:4-amino-4-deoxy-L-arabinose transferase-like glycosyltransferase
MEKPNEFLKKYYQEISFFLVNLALVLTFLLVINLSGILELNILSSKTLLYTITSSSLLIILLRYEYSDIDSKKKVFLKHSSKTFFFASLLLQVIYTNNLHISITLLKPISIILTNYSPIIDFLFYASGIFLLLMHRKEIREMTAGIFKKKTLNSKNNKDEKNNLVEALGVRNKTSLLLLILILIGFTVIKAPYFDYNFTGAHTMKYNTYVEPAKYMVEQNDFTWYQLKYLANPVTNPDGTGRRLPQLPLLEWSLASTFKFLPNNSLEVNTRLVTHTIGLLTLVFTFLLVKKWSNNIYALIVTSLMATNSIVIFTTFVTVYDGINFMFLLISSYLLTKYLHDKKETPLLLTLSGLIAGIGLSIKISFLIWILPVTIFFVLYKNKDLIKKIYDFTVFYIFAGGLYLVTRYSIPNLAEDTQESALKLLGGLSVLILTYLLVNKYQHSIQKLLHKLNSKRLLVPLTLLTLLILPPFIFSFLANDNLIKNFLTDKRFLFNLEFYEYMLTQKFTPTLTKPVFILSTIGLGLLPFVKDKKVKYFNITILLTALFFWVTASKSIFPHDYYTQIIMFSLILPASLLIYSTLEIYSKDISKILLLLLLSFFLLPLSIQISKDYLAPQLPMFQEAAEYLEEQTQEGDLYIDESYLLSLTLRTGRPRVGNVNSFSDEVFKKDVRDLGFKGALDKYNVKYLITQDDFPNYESYVHIFTEEYLESTEFNRGQIILHVLNPNKDTWYTDSKERQELVREYDLESKFVFEKEIGVYRFFRFEN